LFLRILRKWDEAKFREPGSEKYYSDKLQILRNRHAKSIAEKSGRVLSKDSNGNFVFTDPKTKESVTKLSDPITWRSDKRPTAHFIRLGLRDNLSNPDPKYILAPAAVTAGASLETHSHKKRMSSKQKHKD
jgi:hypothetical protein